MRQRSDPQSCLEFTGLSEIKVVSNNIERYRVISKNAGILYLVDRDMPKLSQGAKGGRKGKYTPENIF